MLVETAKLTVKFLLAPTERLYYREKTMKHVNFEEVETIFSFLTTKLTEHGTYGHSQGFDFHIDGVLMAPVKNWNETQEEPAFPRNNSSPCGLPTVPS